MTRLFKRAGLGAVDPGAGTGKVKRIREVLSHAVDTNPDAGDRLVVSLMGQIKASEAFREGADGYAGERTIRSAREAFRAAGYELDPEGNLRPLSLEGLDGVEMTRALMGYVRRGRIGSTDAALVVGTGKDLMEAVARHVLREATGSYPEGSNFPTTLFQAYDRLGLATPPPDMLKALDDDGQRAVEQALWLVACAVNRLRNTDGTGHGRPFLPAVSDEKARVAIEAMGVVSQLLLDSLPRQGT